MDICTRLPRLSSSYCGCTFRTGTLILAWLYVIGGVICIISSGYTLHQIDKNSPDYDQELSSDIIDIVIYSLHFLISILFLIGTFKNKPIYVLIFLWWQAIVLACGLRQIIFAFVATWQLAFGSLAGWLLSIYFFMVINSFYQQIKETENSYAQLE